MTANGVRAKFKLRIRGPMLVQGSESGPWGLDAVALRNQQGHLVIPMDAVRGKVREAFDELSEGDPFGRSREEDVASALKKASAEEFEDTQRENLDAPANQYPINFSDFVSVDRAPAPGDSTVTHIAMDSETGAAAAGMLRFLDCPVQPGKIIDIQGEASFISRDGDKSQEEILAQLKAAMGWVVSFGSQKTVGFGRNMGVELLETSVTDFENLPDSQGRENEIGIGPTYVAMTFDRPLCLPEGVVNGNVFESGSIVRGEVLKGAVAELLFKLSSTGRGDAGAVEDVADGHPFSELCRNFSRIRISNALPQRDEEDLPRNPVGPVPLSWAFCDDGLYDCALLDDETRNALFAKSPPRFQPDWKDKDWDVVENVRRQPHIERELRVRTAVDSNHRSAKPSNLFAYNMVRTEGLRWIATVSMVDESESDKDGASVLSGHNSHPAIQQLLAVLSSGWITVGKTKAFGRGVPLNNAGGAGDNCLSSGCRRWVVRLRGDALMLDPRCLCNSDGQFVSEEEYDRLFQKYWNEVSDGLLTEVPESRFKSDTLVGGYQARRYRYCHDPAQDLRKLSIEKRIQCQRAFPYNPSLLVRMGSVFVLECSEDCDETKLQGILGRWQTSGLPLPEWAHRAYGDTFHTNIFLPQNGYGDVEIFPLTDRTLAMAKIDNEEHASQSSASDGSGEPTA